MTPSVTPQLPPLVGREDLLARFDELLDEQRPAFVALTGPVGAGKSTLAWALRSRALDRHWLAVPAAGDAPLVVTRDTTVRRLVSELAGQLDRLRSLTIDSGPRPSAEGLSSSVAGASAETADGHHTRTGGLMDVFREVCPLLIVIDGFRPNNRMCTWLADDVLPQIKETGLPVVLVTTHDSTLESFILAYADLRLEVGPIDEGATARFFRELAGRMVPPLDAQEVETYAREAARRPELLNCLPRVLSLVEGRDGVTGARGRAPWG